MNIIMKIPIKSSSIQPEPPYGEALSKEWKHVPISLHDCFRQDEQSIHPSTTSLSHPRRRESIQRRTYMYGGGGQLVIYTVQ